MELRGAEGVSLFVGRVGVSFVTTESLSERDDIETGQVKARHTGSVFEQRKKDFRIASELFHTLFEGCLQALAPNFASTTP
jgi:hypothetical protein